MTKPDISAAYDLTSPEESKKLYADWAESYDEDLAVRMHFLMPNHVAGIYADEGGEGPVLDAGAGTGLVGEALEARGIGPVDALDLSPEMLAVAGRKGVYRGLHEGNLLERLPLPDAAYAGVVSSGTFTTGHVGPAALHELLRVAAPGALFVIAINEKFYVAEGFDRKLDALPEVTDLRLEERPYYGAGAEGEHRESVGKIAIFRKG